MGVMVPVDLQPDQPRETSGSIAAPAVRHGSHSQATALQHSDASSVDVLLACLQLDFSPQLQSMVRMQVDGRAYTVVRSSSTAPTAWQYHPDALPERVEATAEPCVFYSAPVCLLRTSAAAVAAAGSATAAAAPITLQLCGQMLYDNHVRFAVLSQGRRFPCPHAILQSTWTGSIGESDMTAGRLSGSTTGRTAGSTAGSLASSKRDSTARS